MVNVCAVCGARQGSETTAKAIVYHRIPPRNQAAKRKKWLEGLQLDENAVTGATRVCSKHFWNGIPCVMGKNMSEHVVPTKRRILVCTPLSPPPSASTQTKNSTHSSTHRKSCVIANEGVITFQTADSKLAVGHGNLHSFKLILQGNTIDALPQSV